MATESSLRRKLNALGPEIKAVVEQGRKIDADNTSLFMFKGLYKSLQSTYDKYIANFEALEDVYESQGKELSEKDRTSLANVKRYYHESNAIYEKYMNPTPLPSAHLDQTSVLNQAIQPPLDQTSLLNQSLAMRTHLPRIILPKFDGNYQDWPTFRDTFLSLIHNEPAIPKIEKFHFLLSCLQGSARSLLQSVPLRDSNYDQAWSILVENFDNKRVLATHHLNALLEFKPLPSKPTLHMLKSFLSSVGENIQAFKLLNIPDADEFILFSLAIRCLDPVTRRRFEKKHLESDFPKFDDLVKFIKDECRTLELSDFRPSNMNPNPAHSVPRPKLKTSLVVEAKLTRPKEGNQNQLNSSKPCPVCRGIHSLYQCYQFRQASNAAKWKLLKSWKGCLNCFNASHKLEDCTSEHSCRICHKRHHTWLHVSDDSGKDAASTSTSNREVVSCEGKDNHELKASPVSLASNSRANDVLLGTAVATIKDAEGNFQPVRMVLDCGSQYSFISADCASRLQLKVRPFNIPISGIGQTALNGKQGIASCVIRPQFGTQLLRTDAVVVERITNELPHAELPKQLVETFKNFDLADPNFHQPGPIEFLLGADLYFEIIKDNPVTIQQSFPKLIPTVLGHVIAGSFQSHKPSCLPKQILFASTLDKLDEEMAKFWQIEEIQPRPIKSPSDIYCEQHFLESHSRTPEGRYIIHLPFKDSFTGDLSESKAQALKRFFNLESKLCKNPILRQEYIHFMNEYINLRHMERASEKGLYFIPHHGVMKEEGENYKLRVVFDASATTSIGSLNDHLHTGPKLQRDITDILVRFRSHPIVFTADMVKMYRQIVLAPRDRRYHHIFWRSDPSQSLEEYQLVTLTYGLSVAPFLALRVIKQLIKDEGDVFPLASRALTEDVYVDDIVTGANDMDSALRLKKELIELLFKGGFELSKWTSNAQELIGDRHQMPLDLGSHDSCIKILGLQWDPIKDIFTYRIKSLQTVEFTKRTVLSTIARIFDPVGYISPTVFFAKYLFQRLWKEKLDWDDKIPSHIEQNWSQFISQLPRLSDVTIPRHISTHSAEECTLIGFSDASERGYSAVIYLRTINNGVTSCYLMKSKTKLAPTKPVTMPRLELCGALLLTRLYTSLNPFLTKLSIKKYYWFTDSTIVLGWLRAPVHHLKTFVAHRILEITEQTNVQDWYHISGETNPADCASRGISPLELLKHPLWWNGPQWLVEEIRNWPIMNIPNKDISQLPETKPISSNTLLSHSNNSQYMVDWIERFSCYVRLTRVMCHVLRFKNKMLGRKTHNLGFISPKEMETANRTCIKIIQQHYFIKDFPESEQFPASTLLKRLNAFRDNENIIRVGGRLENSCLPDKTKHPILLPKCHYTKILIDYYHRAYLHLSPSALQAMLQKSYWIISARTIIRQRVHKCLKCFKESQRPKEPFMASLPSSRFAEGKAFQHTGVDFGGPFIIRDSLRRKAPQSKAYLALFICMTTKCVHLETVSSLSTEAFFAAFDRFIARRGSPFHMYSDCGTNFIGAANKLKDLLKFQRSQEYQKRIFDYSSNKGIEWSFNPPHAPHFGGLWEAGIKSAKTILRKVIGDTPFTFEELYTIFARIEAILNSRPLTSLGSDPESYECLTPGHFLVGGPLTARPEATLLDFKENRLGRWELVQQRIQHYWRRWRSEYLHYLQQRKKWTEKEPNLCVGDLVIVNEANLPPLCWPLARIQEVHAGEDNVVRVVTLRMANGTILTRPVVKIISLNPITSPEHF